MKPMGASWQSAASENLASGLSQSQFPCMMVRRAISLLWAQFPLFNEGTTHRKDRDV